MYFLVVCSVITFWLILYLRRLIQESTNCFACIQISLPKARLNPENVCLWNLKTRALESWIPLSKTTMLCSFDDQEARFLKSACSNDESSWVTMVLKILVSSTKVVTPLDFTTSSSEFTYERNSRGPKIELWGTPEVTGSASEDTPNAITLWRRFSR